MKNTTQIKIQFKTKEEVSAAVIALKQEEEFSKRATSKISADANTLIVDFESEDIVSLRATINAYLRVLQIAEGIEAEQL
ncbi:MAG: KEOPS complex subunit Pcc1 [Candidatus Micrarchaeota archaeon]